MPPPKARPAPPSASSSSGSGSSSSSSVEEEEERAEPQSFLSKKQFFPKKPAAAPTPTGSRAPAPSPAKSASPSALQSKSEDEEEDDDDEEGEDSSSDSDDSPLEKPSPTRRPSRGPDPSIKPIASKHMDADISKTKKPAANTTAEKSKPNASEATEKKKRKALESGGTEGEETANGPSAKKLFQRLWSDEDEIVVLEGLIEYQMKHGGSEPTAAEMETFYEAIRKDLHVEVSKTQLHDKIRRLRKKYNTNLRRGKKGADPYFTKAHDQEAFELSKKLWAGKKLTSPAVDDGDDEDEMDGEAAEGEDGGKKGQKVNVGPIMASPRKGRSGSVNARVTVRENGEDWQERGGHKLKEAVALLESMPLTRKGLFDRALELLEPSKVRALEVGWDRLCLEETKVIAGRSKFMKVLTEALLEVLEGAAS